jgi:hypothetical protein
MAARLFIGVEAPLHALIRALFHSVCTLLAATTLSSAQAENSALAPLSGAADMPPSPWHVVGLPQQRKPFTRFSLTNLDGRRVLRVEADNSYGNLVHPLDSTPRSLQLAWQWRVDELVVAADLRAKAGDDTALKVCVFFDLALEKIPFGERQLLRMARARAAEPLPGAIVCYVWDNNLPVDTAVDNAFTRRLRYLVLQSGAAHKGQWRSERRDVAADFMRLFGAESAQMPPVIGVAIGADADNTHGRSLGFVADLVLQP